jgi:hypothetical protein
MTETVESLIIEHLRAIRGDLALLRLRLDRQGDRIERIEKRLDLTAA